MFDMITYEKVLDDVAMRNTKLNTCMICDNRSKYPCVITNSDAVYNSDYAKQYKVWPLFVGHAGGSILLFPNDIGFTWFSEQSKLQDIVKDILEYLQKYDKNIKMDGNDVMLNDKKLFGTMSNGCGPYYEGMFFSFDIDLDIIKKVCTKEMKKEPIGLSYLGITPKEMAELAENLANKYNLKLYGGGN